MKKIFAALLIIVLLIVIKNLIGSIYSKITSVDPSQNLKEQYLQEQQKNKFLQEQYAYVKTNEFIELEARRKLGMIKQGEHIVIVPSASNLDKKPAAVDNRPNWLKWFKLFF